MLTNEHYMELETVPDPDGRLIPNPRYKANSDSFLKSDYDRDAPKEPIPESQGEPEATGGFTPVIEHAPNPNIGLPTINVPVPENFDYSFDVPGEVHEVSNVTKAERRGTRSNSGMSLDITNPNLDVNVLRKNLENPENVYSV